MMFASKTPRDLNHDPEPWRITKRVAFGEPFFYTGNRSTESRDDGPNVRYAYDPRSFYDHVQHNRPNVWLTGLRDSMRIPGDHTLQDQARIQLKNALELQAVCLARPELTEPPSLGHAIRVLTRLANLTETEVR